MILYYYTWPNVNMPCDIKILNKNKNIKLVSTKVGTLIGAYNPYLPTYLPTYLG